MNTLEEAFVNGMYKRAQELGISQELFEKIANFQQNTIPGTGNHTVGGYANDALGAAKAFGGRMANAFKSTDQSAEQAFTNLANNPAAQATNGGVKSPGYLGGGSGPTIPTTPAVRPAVQVPPAKNYWEGAQANFVGGEPKAGDSMQLAQQSLNGTSTAFQGPKLNLGTRYAQ